MRRAWVLGLVGLVVVLASPITPPPGAQSGIRYVNAADPTCQGLAPCYTTIQAAVNAATAGEHVVLQAGTYQQQVNITGKNNTANATEADRIVIEADPAFALGSVVLDGAVNQCTNGYAIRLQQSKFITIRGLTITGAGGQAISLMGANNQNQGIHLERLRIFGNGSGSCDGGITIARGNPGTLILNSLIYANGRNGVATIDADGGPHYLIGNTIHGNQWSGVSVTRTHEIFLVNNAITGNGTASGSTGGRFGVSREGSTTPQSAGIHLLNNLICGNRLGEINGPALDATDSGNLTPTGGEGLGVTASPGCNTTATVYADVAGPDGALGTADDDFRLATSSPALDHGMDPRTLGLATALNPLLETDFTGVAGARPKNATGAASPLFDIGGLEADPADNTAPVVTIIAPPANAHVRGAVPVEARATDGGGGVASLMLRIDTQALTVTLTPTLPPPTDSVTATATWNTTAFPEGAHTLTAAAEDAAGNPATATRVLVVDNTPPETQITGGPSGEIGETTATFTFAGSDNLTSAAALVFAWRIDGGSFTPFSSETSASRSGLSEGAHTFEVKARDLAGNEDPTPATRTFAVVLAPVITSVSPSSGPIGTLVTVGGSGFVAGATTVAFNGTPAVVRTLTSSNLTTTVPPGSSTGPLTITTSRGVASAPFTVVATQDFSLTALPGTAQVIQGTSATYTLELPSTGGTTFTGSATLTVEGLPSGVTAAFGAAALTGGQRGSLTVTAAPAAATGSATLTVRATATTDLGLVVRTTSVALQVQPGGRTALAGQVTFVSGAPIPGVQLSLGTLTATTDAGGNFLFLDPPAGTQMLGVDANAAQPGLPIYAVDVTLVAGQALQLGAFRITPPPPAEAFVPIDNASTDQVVTDARYPGLSITLPAGVTITGWDGVPKNKIALERLSPDALPVPPPRFFTRSFYQVFFGTPMGGIPSGPLPVSVPNDQNLDPGQQANIWYYDAAPFPGVPAGWRLAGTGTVSADGTRVASDPGVGIERFCGVCGIWCIEAQAQQQANANPQGPAGGEPVDLGTGLMLVDKVDLVLPGRVPAIVQRKYNPLDPFGGVAGFELPTGPGWTLSVDVVLLEIGPNLRRLILPGNARFGFAQQPDGTFVNETYPDLAGAVLTQFGSQHDLRFKDGRVWRFRSGWRSGGFILFGLGLLVEDRDRQGNALSILRDDQGAVTRLTEPAGRSLDFTIEIVNGHHRVTEIRDPLGRTVRYTYTGTDARLETVTDPAGGITSYTYDASGGILTITDPRSITFVTNEYDAQGRVIRQTEADGGVWTFAYEGPLRAHTRVTLTNPRGFATIHRMNNGGFGTEVTDPLGQVTTQVRDAVGRVTAVTDSLGRTARVEYDARGNVTRLVDPAGRERLFTYEPVFSQVTSDTDALGKVTRFEYDAQGNRTAIVDPLGQRTTFTYNAFGQAVTATSPLAQTVRFEYDTTGNLHATIDPLGNRSERDFDAVSRVVRARDAVKRVTRLTYDAVDHLETRTDAHGGVTQFTYDPNGNLLDVIDARGGVTSFRYDPMDRIEGRTDPLLRSGSFAYDLRGNPTTLVDRKGQAVSSTYDALDRLVEVAYADGSSTRRVYDAGGGLVQIIDSGVGATLRSYDVLDRLIQEATPQGTVQYSYDAADRRASMTVGGQASVLYVYDDVGRLTDITQGTSAVRFTYDAGNRRTSAALPNGVATEYGYDDASRLISLTYKQGAAILGTLAYGYDANGRRQRIGGTWARMDVPVAVASAGHNAANQLLMFGPDSLAYDFNGNLTSDGANTYTWNARNQLAAITGPTPAGFVYDGLGRRQRKTVNGITTEFLYEGLNPVQELAGSSIASLLTGAGLDEYITRTDSAGARHFLVDALLSTVALTTPDGTVETEYTYAPFGTTTVLGPAANAFDYTGREDDGTGLKYYRARHYHPRLARFISEDPIGFAGGDPNLYAYVGNSPLNWADPRGLTRGDWWDARTYTPDLDRARVIAGEVLAETQRNFPGSRLHNDAADAWRHARWSSRMVNEIGWGTAVIGGYGHELESLYEQWRAGQPFSWDEMLMDLHNNREGRSGRDAWRLLAEGRLRTMPIDHMVEYGALRYRAPGVGAYGAPGLSGRK